MTDEENQRITDLIISTPLKDELIFYSEKRWEKNLRIGARNVGFIIGFVIETENAPDYVQFTDFGNLMRVNVPGKELPLYKQDNHRLLPIAASEKDLRGAIFANITNSTASIFLEGLPPGYIKIYQLYYDIVFSTENNWPLIPVNSFRYIRRISTGRDDIIKAYAY